MFLILLSHILHLQKERGRIQLHDVQVAHLDPSTGPPISQIECSHSRSGRSSAAAGPLQPLCSLSTTMTSMTTSTSLSPPSQQCAFSTVSPAIHSYNESVSEMTNDQLADPTTISGFTTLIHSPPKDRSTTPRRALFGKVDSRFTPSITSA